MALTFIKYIPPIPYLRPFIIVLAFWSPLPVIAGQKNPSCTDARIQIEKTHNALRSLKHQQQQLQQHVRTIYQELFACRTGAELSFAQQQRCTQLQEEGPKQFQAMIEVITRSHQNSQQLAHQTRQVQLACPAIAEETPPQITGRVSS